MTATILGEIWCYGALVALALWFFGLAHVVLENGGNVWSVLTRGCRDSEDIVGRLFGLTLLVVLSTAVWPAAAFFLAAAAFGKLVHAVVGDIKKHW